MITLAQRIRARQEVVAVEMVCQSYKIGKTGQSVDDRYINSDYPDNYNHIKPIFSGSKQDASEMESYLIDCCKDHYKCDNRKDGEASYNDEMADAEVYHVYVVWKQR